MALGTQQYDPVTALIVVDVQHDFASPDGALSVSGGEEIIASVNAEIAAARRAGALVVATQDWHPASTPHFARDGGLWPVHCVADTPGAQLHPALDLPPTAPRVLKGTGSDDGYSGFSEKDLASGAVDATVLGDLLSRAGIRRLVVVGLAGDYCVKATALDGASLGFDVTVPLALTRFVDPAPTAREATVHELRAAGVKVEPDGG